VQYYYSTIVRYFTIYGQGNAQNMSSYCAIEPYFVFVIPTHLTQLVWISDDAGYMQKLEFEIQGNDIVVK